MDDGRTLEITTIVLLYVLPHGILHVFNTILYENEIQNPQIFQQTISLFPEQSTLVVVEVGQKLSRPALFSFKGFVD
jgi:hypothetical protein